MHLRFSNTQYQNGCDTDGQQSSKDTMQLIKQPLTIVAVGGLQQQQTFTSKRIKRLFLWSILLIQFGFILCFWLLQLGLSDSLKESTGRAAAKHLEPSRINFIKSPESKKDVGEKTNGETVGKTQDSRNFQWPSRDLKFQQDFELQQIAYNLTDAEKVMFGEPSTWCFKEGTTKETRPQRDDDPGIWPDVCDCLPDWHGQDCGQPEIIWRALMTAKMPFKLQNPAQDESHRLVYMIEGPFFSMDLMELQIQAVMTVVDYFIIYYKRNPVNMKELKILKYRLRQNLPNHNYMIYHCKLVALTNCSSAEVYRLFRQHQLPSNAIKPTDLFIYSDDKTILGHRALNFLKYYSFNMPLIEFRAKFIVYGFYWQHPDLTKLQGSISSFQLIDNSNSDPSQLRRNHASNNAASRQTLVMGDLNHFGGWFCKYCQQPDEIINELQLLQSSLSNTNATTTKSIHQNAIAFPTDKKHSLHIDVNYIQQLISTGVYLNDGKTKLLKVRRFTDKYFAPVYASQQSWKYGHLLLYRSILSSCLH
ncbi:beta-1,4-mannosyl-glycoprotein 4-beta-N-acetylglucosaminyltransferase [Stomoxys calcitrans]|uniref:beta-1,4-mannosyl-glycoprotein 4-beta-N-acetylglucosaminyltransferase n=1 Tax=Stomoxys calcitrans TaxID=35570 RepID=UPI0027E2D8B4|nr:beta-1,4-mannosyl-glycoprotein 4-beta-N-acetylglucosaminyltransferase [Stomoxys calcitrans]